MPSGVINAEIRHVLNYYWPAGSIPQSQKIFKKIREASLASPFRYTPLLCFPMKSHVFVFLFLSFHVEPCAFEEHHRGTESGSLSGRSYFSFVLMIFEWYEHHAIINIPEGVLMVGGYFVWINVLFYLNISLHVFLSSVLSLIPSYFSIMNLLLSTWPITIPF